MARIKTVFCLTVIQLFLAFHVLAQETEKQATPDLQQPPAPPPKGPTAKLLPRLGAAVPPASAKAGDVPFGDTGDRLRSVPGAFVTRPEGEAVAQRLLLRGLDAQYGQDLEYTLYGAPLNQASHIHGQGYADLSFVPAEVLASMQLSEGSFQLQQGDFANAGSVDLQLGVADRGGLKGSQFGSFRTFRQIFLWAPMGQRPETFGVFNFRTTRGFGERRKGRDVQAWMQHAWGDAQLTRMVYAGFYGNSSQLAGLLRQDDVEAGRVGFYDAYDEAGANDQRGSSMRAQLGFRLLHQGDRGSRGDLHLWGGWSLYLLRENTTGSLEPGGDVRQQADQAGNFGLQTAYRSPQYRIASWLWGQSDIGLRTHVTLRSQSQDRLAEDRSVLANEVNADIEQLSADAWFNIDWHLVDIVRIYGGLRVGVAQFDVKDQLNLQHSALGVAAVPRGFVEISPWSWLVLASSFGQAYRSPHARQIDASETVHFTKSTSIEQALRAHWGKAKQLAFAASFFWLRMRDDVFYDPLLASSTPLPDSERLGGILRASAQPWSWLYASLSATFTRARFDDSDFAQATLPGVQSGARVPGVPTTVVRAEAAVSQRYLGPWRRPFTVKGGFGLSWLSDRPVPLHDDAPPVLLADLSLQVVWSLVEFSFDFFNLFNSRYVANHYVYTSAWDASGNASRLPSQHMAAAAPFGAQFTLGLRF